MRRHFSISRIPWLILLLTTASCSGGATTNPPAYSSEVTHGATMRSNVGSGVAAGPVTSFYVDPKNSRQLDVKVNNVVKTLFIKGVDYGLTQIGDYPDPNPLDDANVNIWTPNLAAMRAAGVNAVKVYNVTLKDFTLEKPKPNETGKVGAFLTAAWNGGRRPIYVVLSIFFGGVDVLDGAKLRALKAEYLEMATTYSTYPAMMGISVGSEINSEAFINRPEWWSALNQVSASISSGYQAAGARKIITTTMVDDSLNTVVAGEANNFAITAWGVDAYRGHTFTDIWRQVRADTTKPFIMAEYGAPAAYHSTSTATYSPTQFVCQNYPPNLPPPENVAQLPPSGNPRMQFLVHYARDNANELFSHSTKNGGVGSGGFYFEWNDEWWKSGYPKEHLGGAPSGTKIVVNQNAVFPGCYQDEAWFGLNAMSKGNPNVQTPRPTLNALKAVWATQAD